MVGKSHKKMKETKIVAAWCALFIDMAPADFSRSSADHLIWSASAHRQAVSSSSSLIKLASCFSVIWLWQYGLLLEFDSLALIYYILLVGTFLCIILFLQDLELGNVSRCFCFKSAGAAPISEQHLVSSPAHNHHQLVQVSRTGAMKFQSSCQNLISLLYPTWIDFFCEVSFSCYCDMQLLFPLLSLPFSFVRLEKSLYHIVNCHAS